MKIKSHSLLCILATIALSSPLSALSVNAQKAVSKTWNPNLKNGMYRNPVIDADYSDPDVCRVGNDYYMTSKVKQCNLQFTLYTETSTVIQPIADIAKVIKNNIYDLSGRMVKLNAKAEDLQGLKKGIYIYNKKKYVAK